MPQWLRSDDCFCLVFHLVLFSFWSLWLFFPPSFGWVQIWVAEPEGREDLCNLVRAYLQGSVPHPPVDNAVNFYQAAKAAAVCASPLCINAAIMMEVQILAKQCCGRRYLLCYAHFQQAQMSLFTCLSGKHLEVLPQFSVMAMCMTYAAKHLRSLAPWSIRNSS